MIPAIPSPLATAKAMLLVTKEGADKVYFALNTGALEEASQRVEQEATDAAANRQEGFDSASFFQNTAIPADRKGEVDSAFKSVMKNLSRLPSIGGKVVNVAVHEWRTAGAAGGEAAREGLLRRLLAAQGAAVEDLLNASERHKRGRELEGVAEAVAAARLVAGRSRGADVEPPPATPAEEAAAAEAVAQRAQRLDMIKASQGKLSRLGLAKRTALRNAAVAAKGTAAGGAQPQNDSEADAVNRK